MQLEQIEARIRRLGELAMGLIRERARWDKDAVIPVDWTERATYTAALTEAIRGLETARVELASVLARTRKESSSS